MAGNLCIEEVYKLLLIDQRPFSVYFSQIEKKIDVLEGVSLAKLMNFMP